MRHPDRWLWEVDAISDLENMKPSRAHDSSGHDHALPARTTLLNPSDVGRCVSTPWNLMSQASQTLDACARPRQILRVRTEPRCCDQSLLDARGAKPCASGKK
jgi:hypothetical protein